MPADDLKIAELLASLCDETISSEEMRHLDRLILSDAAVRRRYVEYIDLHARLSRGFHRPSELIVEGQGIGDWGYGPQAVDAAVELPRHPAVSPYTLPPLPSPLSSPFVGGPIFSYMAATIILGLMLLGAWAYTITHDHNVNIAENSRGQTAPGDSADNTPELVFVGQITGMKDCRWVDPGAAPFAGSYVSLNRKYVLSSGLLEITYNSGAKAILEGPCAYEVDSDAGGFLSLGKLTARVDIAKPQAANTQYPRPKTQDQNPKISKSLFTVRTPTAVVTDLGTEFGVEVGKDGNTDSFVFQGSVRVQAVGESGNERTMVLRANESVRIEKVGKASETHQAQDASESVRFTHPATPPKFVRRIAVPPKSLDLLDILAGGNGLGNRRERGIDPASGMEDPAFILGKRIGDGQFHAVAWHKLIDGVFIPGGGPMQIDSAGGTFDGFPKTAGSTWGSIWPRAAEVDPELEQKGWVYEILRSERFMPEGRGFVGVCPNVGVTFDLASVRRMHKDARPERLKTLAGLGERAGFESPFDGKVDLWVIVDGKARLKRMGLKRGDGLVEIDVCLSDADRFLTLAATDGGDGQAADWVIFGDSVLQLKPIEEKP